MYLPLLLILLHLKHVIASINDNIFIQHQSKGPASTVPIGNDSKGELGYRPPVALVIVRSNANGTCTTNGG